MPKCCPTCFGPRYPIWWRTCASRASTARRRRPLTWKTCANSSTICCLHRKIPLPPAISVQCWLRFRAWRRTVSVPLRQLHSNPHHLADDLGFLGMAQNANRNGRQGMRLQDNVIATHAAPAASVPVAGLDKIYRAFILGTPRAFHHFILSFVDLDEAAGRKNRVHREVLVPDVAVGKIAVGELR